MSENWYVIYDESGNSVSIGTIVADPLPERLSSILLSDTDSEMLLSGKGEWDASTLKVKPSAIPIPPSVSARQIRLWLIRNGISLQSITDSINNIQDQILRDSVAIEWEYAPYIERNHAMLVPLANSLGLTEADIDRAFIEASLI
jgi:hypothetical protein